MVILMPISAMLKKDYLFDVLFIYLFFFGGGGGGQSIVTSYLRGSDIL